MEEECVWSTLDANLVACVFMHLDPPTLAQVSQACRALSQESESDAVWCALFLRRFGSDLWGERAGPHPYHAVPRTVNEWSALSPSEAFTRFSQRLTIVEYVVEKDDEGVRPAQGTSIESALNDYAKQRETREGYGGWKAAFKTMAEMVRLWRTPVSTGYLIAGLASFGVLSRVADLVVDIALAGLKPKPKEGALLGDATSPAGECRVIRLIYHDQSAQPRPVEHVTNICVLRKPREWYMEGMEHFRGMRFNDKSALEGLRLIYVIDGAKMESGAYQECVYRELHGLIGEGKGYYQMGMPIQLCIINAASGDPLKILERLKVPPCRRHTTLCPYYAGPVLFVINSFALVDGDEDSMEVEENTQERRRQLERGFDWLSRQPSLRPHRNKADLLLCALQEDIESARRRMCGRGSGRGRGRGRGHNV